MELAEDLVKVVSFDVSGVVVLPISFLISRYSVTI
jgi:hypothetical protein